MKTDKPSKLEHKLAFIDQAIFRWTEKRQTIKK